MLCVFFFFKQKTAYEMRISDWSSDVCSSDLHFASPSRSARATLISTITIPPLASIAIRSARRPPSSGTSPIATSPWRSSSRVTPRATSAAHSGDPESSTQEAGGAVLAPLLETRERERGGVGKEVAVGVGLGGCRKNKKK